MNSLHFPRLIIGIILGTAALGLAWVQTVNAQFINTGNTLSAHGFMGTLQLDDDTQSFLHGEWWFDTVYIAAGCTLCVDAYSASLMNSGSLILHANSIQVDGKIDAKGCGYQGGGGSNGQNNGSGGAGGYGDANGFDGILGANAIPGIPGGGGEGGNAGSGGAGYNGQSGINGVFYSYGPYGSITSSQVTFGGQGGAGGSGSGLDAQNGGYLGPQSNYDNTTDISLQMGSGGGGGGGGAGGGGGGGGGGTNNASSVITGPAGTSGWAGGAGGNGGKGGGLVKLFANYAARITGVVDTSGNSGLAGITCPLVPTTAGSGGRGGAGTKGGDGAGGGILIYCPVSGGLTLASSLNAQGGNANVTNGGTIKIFTPDTLSLPLLNALSLTSGRVMTSPPPSPAPLPPALIPPTDSFSTSLLQVKLSATYLTNSTLSGCISFQVSTDASFGNMKNMVLYTTSSTPVPSGTEVDAMFYPDPLPPSTPAYVRVYYWRAQAIDASEISSAFSATGTITILPSGWPPQITAISPVSGQSGLRVNMTISGANFKTNMPVSLSNGQTDIWAQTLSYQNASAIQGTLDLTGVPAGSWQVYVHDQQYPANIMSNGAPFTVLPLAPTVLQVAYLAPNYGMAGKTIQVMACGAASGANPSLKLILGGNPVITSAGAAQNDSYSFNYTLNLTNAVPSCYDVTITANSTPPQIQKQAFVVILPIPAPLNWAINDLGAASGTTLVNNFCGLDIGDADRDNRQELYAANQDPSLYMFKKDSYGWSVNSLSGNSGTGYACVVLANSAGDQSWEICSGATNNHAYQFSLTGNSWQKLDLGISASALKAIARADLNHDGIAEIYAAGSDGTIYQFAGAAPTAVPGCPGSQVNALAAGDGDNDGEVELYSANVDYQIHQYKYSNSLWQISVLGTAANVMNAVAVGDGDNDGKNEVYGASKDGYVYQCRRGALGWSCKTIGLHGGAGMNAVAVSDGDNDGLNEVYAACGDGHVYEFKCQSGNWETLDLGNANTPLYSLAVGDADNDHYFEVYALGQNNHVYQFKSYSIATPTATPTFTATATPTATPVYSATVTPSATLAPSDTVTPTPIPDSERRLRIFHSQINPVHGERARIRWYQSADAAVTLKIFNLLGDKIITLAENQPYPGGQINEIDWNGRTSRGTVAGSGIYFVFFQAGSEKGRGKIAVVK